MITKRKLNSTKRQLSETMKEIKEIIKHCDEENNWNITDIETNRDILLEKLRDFGNDLEEFGASLPENEESEILINNYEDVYLEGDSLVKTLRRRLSILVKEQMEIEQRQADKIKREQDEKDREMKRERDEKDREMKREQEEKNYKIMQMEKEKDRELALQLEEMKLQNIKTIELEKLRIEQLKIDADVKEKAMEIEKEMKVAEIKRDTVNDETSGANGHQRNIRLPKLDLTKFDGNIFKWQEFWDCFNTSIHNKGELSRIDKFNYLRSQLRNDAKDVIAGLETTKANYDVAIELLQERYGKKQLIINAHYAKLKEMPQSSNYYEKLRTTFDTIEIHLRSLETLGENIENNLMMSLLQSKLPKHVLARLEEYKNNDNDWTVQNLRKELKRYIAAQEIGNRLVTTRSDAAREEHIDNNRDRNKFTRRTTTSFHVADRQQQRKCIYCSKEHWSDECKDYPDIQSRKKQIHGCCYICLKKGHQLRDCSSKRTCVYCNKERNHHRSLCPKQFQQVSTITNDTGPSLLAMGEEVIMQTAMVEVTNPVNEASERTRLLLDCGSQRSYITEDLAKKLRLETIGKNHLTLNTFGTSKPRNLETAMVKLGIQLKSGFVINIKANVVPVVTGEIERTPIKSKAILTKLKTFELADQLPKSLETTEFHLLIGNDYYNDIVSMKRIQVTNTLYLLGSKIGWILTGRVQSSDSTNDGMAMFTSSRRMIQDKLIYHEDENIENQIEPKMDEFWKLECIGIKETAEETTDDKVLESFNNTVQKRNGRYHVQWPWKSDSPGLPDNYRLAYGRLKSNIKRMKENEQLLTAYDEIIKNQLEKGVIELVENDSNHQHLVHYIPHHAVITPGNATTKIRIVYDASAKSKKENKSLNECMYRGPVILEDLCTLLLKFRTNKIAMVADIEKAFLQIALQENDRDVTRFLWLKDLSKPVTEDNLQVYRFSRVPFGIISSPFLLGGSVQHHLKSIGTETASKVSKELYVDNLISGEDTPIKAIQLYNKSKYMFKDISMNLREWASNSPEVMQNIPDEDHAKGNTTKVLGLEWKPQNDTISIRYKNKPINVASKRQILKITAGVFDPLGLFTPVTLRSKILLRELWQEEKEWDDPINDDQQKIWESILKDLNELDTIKLPRYVGNENCKLVCFTDASGLAYATTVYLLTEINGKTTVNLIFSKSRIAPVTSTSIPRLELLGVLIGTRSLNFVQKSLQIPVTKKILWTDSQCVISWIKSTKPLPCFVENRLKEIKTSRDIEYRYVNTKDNPADLATRGKTLEELRNSDLWWYGPKWLHQSEDSWPHWNIEIIDQETLNNLAKSTKGSPILYEISAVARDGPTESQKAIYGENNDATPFGIRLQDYSSLNKLVRVTSWIARFLHNKFLHRIKSEGKKEGALTSEEISNARMMWIKHVQKEATKQLVEKKKNKKEANNLNLQADTNGIIRCYGRLTTINLGDEDANPIYLPKKNHFTKLVIKEHHERLFHAGTSHTLSFIRRTYWIPHGRTEVRSAIFRCGTCKKYQGGPFKMPNMSPWPRIKVTRSSPFTHTGLDYLGPLYVREENSKKKVWICLFTCVTVRAIHLEVIDNMSADQFLMALRRFISRRGKPSEIICDNAKQFKLTKKVVDNAWNKVINDETVLNYASTQEIKWKFIVEFSPWTGGFYERLVGMVKSSLRKSIGPLCLTKTQLNTFVIEAESILNSRPLVYVNEDIESSNTITPSNFLNPIPKLGTPVLDNDNEIDEKDDEDYIEGRETSAEKLLKLWKRGQAHLNRLWKVWYQEYVLSLRERYQYSIKESRSTSDSYPSVGEIVHIKEDAPRGMWKMGKIEQLIKSNDGEIRAAKVKISNGHVLKRPLNLLYPMELAESTTHKEVIGNKTDGEKGRNDIPTKNETKDKPRTRPRRNAYKNANEMIRIQLNDD